MPGTEKVELLRGTQQPSSNYAVLIVHGFPEMHHTYQEIYEFVEPKLENEEQKNAVKAALNAFGDEKGDNNELSHIGFSVLNDLGQVYKGTLLVSELMVNLQKRAEEAIDLNLKKEHPNLKIALKNIKKDLERARDMSGEAGEPVKKVISWDELQERAKNDNKVHIHKDDSTLMIKGLSLKVDDKDHFPKESYTARHIANMIEGKLKNDEQKNAVRELLNQFISKPDEMMFTNFIAHSNALIKGKLTADSYMDKLYGSMRALNIYKSEDTHYQNAWKYVLNDTRRAAKEKKKAENGLGTPDVSEKSVRFFNNTLQTVTAVKGKRRDSPEYMNFYVTLRSAGEMMSVLHAADQGGKDRVTLDPRKLSDNTQSILKGFYSDGKIKISTEQLKQVYESTYGRIAKYAKVYEDYKHRTKAANKYNSNDVGKLNVTRLFTGSPEVSMPSKGRKNNL